jgi:hypothetical protein
MAFNPESLEGLLNVNNEVNFNEKVRFFDNVDLGGVVNFTGNVSFNNLTVSGTANITDLTVNSIYANVYKNFKFSALPTTSVLEPTYGPNRILRVKPDGTGYELVDSNIVISSNLTSYGLSGDGNVHTGLGENENSKFKITGISTGRFLVGEKVKIFGVTPTTDSATIADIVVNDSSITKVGTADTVRKYRYWLAQYDFRNGKVGNSKQITPLAGIGAPDVGDFNDLEHTSLTIARTDLNHGVLVYRQESADGDPANINNAKLVAILGSKELGEFTTNSWKDYGSYDRTEWSTKTGKNEFNDQQIHFPNIAVDAQRRGWAIDEVDEIGSNYILVKNTYNTNIGIGTTNAVKIVHDNTYAFKTAIDDAISVGTNSLTIPSGTYLTNSISLPSNFTIKGAGKNTIIKQQYFALDATDGGGNSLSLTGNLIGVSSTTTADVTLTDITIDGNSTNNINFSDDVDNYLVYLLNVETSLLKDFEIRNSPGDGLYVYNSRRLSIENCSFVDGSLTDRYNYMPLNAQQSEVLRVNDCLFENYPGAVDLSVTTVASTGGNIIRNCGTGLRTYATGKISTINNIILGPADEFIPTPDIYDSDYNSVNISIQRGLNFQGPVLQYHEDGDPKDISSSAVAIEAGIGTIINAGLSSETLGTKFLNFNIPTSELDRQGGYIQLTLPSSQTSVLGLTSSLGYDIIGTEFKDLPVGVTTYISILSGTWNLIGAGATQYTVTLLEPTQFSSVSVGDVVKLVNHSVSPDLSATELTVAAKINAGAATKQLRLTGLNVTSSTNGDQSGYITIKNRFTIAKGRVGVL